MKPLTLYMRNFKSYGDKTPVFDFNSFDIVLLTGDNGNGKSSIADAISWCIWGQCKGMTGRGGMDDLVRTGADDMEVAFSFEEDGNRYKIVRKRDKGRQQSSLDLFIETEGEFLPISGNSISETQSKIQSIIKLDYDTYLCTAYLSQGKADMFAVKRPNERKEILAEILNLSDYDRLEELAQEARRQLQADIEIVEREIRGLEGRVEGENTAVKDLNVVEERIEASKEREQKVQEELDKALKLYREKSVLVKSLEGYRTSLTRVKREIKASDREKDELIAKLESYRQLIEREDTIAMNYNRAKELKDKESLYRERLQIRTDLIRQLESIENRVDREKKEIEYNIKLLEQQIAMEERKLYREKELSEEQASVIEILDKLRALEDKIVSLEDEIGENTSELARLMAEKSSLESQIEELRERYIDLSRAEANCPTCHTPLSDNGKVRLLKDIEEEGQKLQRGLEVIKKGIQDLKGRQMALKRDIDISKGELKNKGKVEAKGALIERELREAEAAKARLKTLTQKIAPLKKNIEEGQYAKEFLQSQLELRAKLDNSPYDEGEHKQIRAELKELANIENAYQEVQLAKVKFSTYEESLVRLKELLRERMEYEEELKDTVLKLEGSAEGIDQLEREIGDLERKKKIITEDLRRLQSEKGALHERLNQIRDAIGELEEKKKSLVELNEKLSVYKALINIYGKKGIQAAIIENAIPELQDETNRILNKITDGQLTVEFLTQRDTKSGNTVETLDIKISDGLDTRKYETYSGGEEFRINFGIRIALSKILARRAGATVRMLVLDEGFGTLDEKGRERLAQVINAISDEFEKIIVITHIQDLKDYFSNQIEVYMTPSGSMFKPL